MSRDPRKDRARKKRLRRRNAAWAERTASARYPKVLRRLYGGGVVWNLFRTGHPVFEALALATEGT